MSDDGDKLRRGPWVIAMILFIAALFVVPELRRMMGPERPTSTPRLDCYAAAVALRQHLFAVTEADPAAAPDYASDLDERFAEMLDWTRGLRRRDDPRAHVLGSVVARAEAARDEALASDPTGYLRSGWDQVRGCHDELWLGVEGT